MCEVRNNDNLMEMKITIHYDRKVIQFIKKKTSKFTDKLSNSVLTEKC